MSAPLQAFAAAALPEVPVLERPPVDWERHRGDKRPKILPPPGEVWRNPSTGRKVGHRYYTRVTTYADALTEQYNLTQWKLWKLLVGLGQRSDYVRQASALTMEERDRDARDELVAKALEAAGPDAAGLGTALHTLTERLDRGDDIGTPPDEVLPDLAAYTALTSGLIAYRHREARTVCDQLECAGTPDGHAHVAEPCPAGCGPEVLHIIDTKTGSIRYPGKMSTQLAIYAHSDLYEPATGERTPVEVCRSWGAIIHLPTETGEAAAFWLDLEYGWRGAEIAGPLREWRKVGADDILRPFSSVQPVKIVDGEVTRIAPRLASTNIKAPPAPALGDVTELLAESLAARGVQLDDPETVRDEQLDGEPEHIEVVEVVTSTSLDGCDVRVVGTGDNGEPLHWCADHDSSWPHEVAEAVHRAIVGDEADRPAPVPDDLEATRRPGLPIAPGPDTCAHSGGRTMRGRALVCRDCGEPAGFAPAREPEVEASRCVAMSSTTDPAATRCELRAGHAGAHEYEATPTPVERCVHELLAGQCAAPSCRPDLAHLDDSGVEPEPVLEPLEPEVVQQLDEVLAEEVDAERERVGWPGVDDVPVEQLASGPDSDAEDEPEVDEIAAAIERCVTTRDLELLGSTAWRSWNAEHRALAAEVHERLAAAEAASKPRAAFEAAVRSATSRRELLEIMNTAGGAEWLTPELEQLAGDRWAELRGTA